MLKALTLCMLLGVYAFSWTPLAIQAEGRVQPLDSYASRMLRQWCGAASYDGMTAESVLVAVALYPDSTRHWPLFRIDRSDVAQALGLPGGRERRYTYAQLRPAAWLLENYAFAAETLHTAFSLDMKRLWKATQVYAQWSHSLAPLRNAEAPARLDDPVRVLPTGANGDEWSSLGSLLASSERLQIGESMRHVAPQAFFPSARALQEYLPLSLRSRLWCEYLYNKFDPFGWASWWLLLSPLLLIVKKGRRWLPISVAGSLLLSMLGFASRFYVTGRPPVASLYESMLFVGFACALAGLLLQRLRRLTGALPIGAILGGLFYMLASLWAGTDDTLGVLSAVLNSPIWLTLHVITIILGYAGLLVAGISGHGWLVACACRRLAFLPRLRALLYGSLGFGLLFTVVGTLFGGVWADQAWGRFWGWDPKENGALFLILWTSVLLHARRDGLVLDRGLALGAGFGLLALALAWFGVNMLGVGLHSYGAMPGQAWALGGYAFGQSLLLWELARRTRTPD